MHIKKLDGLRGIFSLSIVFLHLPEEVLPKIIYESFLIREAQIFVDFFFVLSGFVIALNYNKAMNINEMFNFLKKRFIRIYPLLFFTTVVLFIYAYFIAGLIKLIYPEIFIHQPKVYYSLTKLFIDNLLLLNSTPILGSYNGLNGPSWSISAEMISYFTFAITSIYFVVKKRSYLFAFLLFVSGLFVVYYGKFFTAGDYGFVRGFIGFGVGYFAWWIYNKQKQGNQEWFNYLEFLIPIAVLSELYFLGEFRADVLKHEMFALCTVPILMGLILFVLLNSRGVFSSLLVTKPFQFLGKVSYSVYLNHTIFVLLLPKVFYKVLKFEESLGYQIVAVIIILLSVISFSYLTYLFIEKKFSIKMKKWLKVSP